MAEITLKRHIIRYYFIILLYLSLPLGFGIFIVFESIDFGFHWYLFFLIIFSFSFAFYIYYIQQKHIKSFSINEKFLIIDGKKYKKDEIKSINLLYTDSFTLFLSWPLECATIKFNNGKEINVYDYFYTNAHEFKQFLDQVYIQNQNYQPITIHPIHCVSIVNQKKEKFKGHPLLCFEGLSFWLLVIFLFYKETKYLKLITIDYNLIITGLILFYILSKLMNYFILTKEFLIIRNHHYWWKCKIFKFDDIKEVVYIKHFRRIPPTLRIIFNDFSIKEFRACTLNEEKWNNFKKSLLNKGIRFINYSYF